MSSDRVHGGVAGGLTGFVIVLIVLAAIAGCGALVLCAKCVCKPARQKAPAATMFPPAQPEHYGQQQIPMVTATALPMHNQYGGPAVAHVTPVYNNP